MSYVSDLHIHSPYARGTSGQLTFDNLARWAKVKGIDLLASGDFTHPLWLQETRKKLREVGDGTFEHDGVSFVLGTEVNCVSDLEGRHRRVHILVSAPGLQAVDRINRAFDSRGKLHSDGRPTLQASPRDLLRVLLDIDSRCMVIPAHLWTPWFGLYGSKSGFDSLEECFGDLAGHLYAVETGAIQRPGHELASAIPGRRLHRLLLRRPLAAETGPGADGHPRRPELRGPWPRHSRPGLSSIQSSSSRRRASTTTPATENAACGTPPTRSRAAAPSVRSAGRRLTPGVSQRVEELAGRSVETWVDEAGFTQSDTGRPPFRTLVALHQVISESLRCGPQTKKAQAAYFDLVSRFGSELTVLTDAEVSDIARVSGDRVADGVARVRVGNISIEPGYDGVYGTVRIWPDSGG